MIAAVNPSRGWMLEIHRLGVGIPTPRGLVRAVDGVGFGLERGRTLAIVGESGCGKSMLCRAIAGLLPPAAVVSPGARICFGRRNLASLPGHERRRILGRDMALIFQDPMSTLNPVMKIGRQVAEGLVFHYRMRRRQARARAVAMLGSVGIPAPEERAAQYPHQLSGGMRQRAAIAMALACEPALLIADEPTTALDVTVQADILDLLSRFQQERGMTLLLVTHDLAVAVERAHEIAVMYAGRIVEMAPAHAFPGAMRMPYSRALAEALPKLDNPPHSRLQSIGGAPPSLIAPSSGCRFAPRCPSARRRCHAEAPPLSGNGVAGHVFACWYPLGER